MSWCNWGTNSHNPHITFALKANSFTIFGEALDMMHEAKDIALIYALNFVDRRIIGIDKIDLTIEIDLFGN